MKHLLRALACLIFAGGALAAPINLQSTNSLKLNGIDGFKRTHTSTGSNIAPTCSLAPAQIDFTRLQVAAPINLSSFCSDIDGDTLAYTVTGGSLPTGLTLVSGQVVGTPTVVQAPSITFNASDGSLSASFAIILNVANSVTPDTIPDAFTLLSNTSAAISTASSCPAITPSGYNTATSVTATVNGSGTPEYRVPAGSGLWIAGATVGTIQPGQSIEVRRISGPGAGQTRNVTLTIGGTSGICAIVTAASPVRTGLVYSLRGGGINQSLFNPNPSQIPTDPEDPLDGIVVTHVAQNEGDNDWGASAAVRALPHFEVVQGESNGFKSIDEDDFYFRGTIYHCALNSPVVNYEPMNDPHGSNHDDDKPRINIQAKQALDAVHMHYAHPYRVSLTTGVDANYVADSVSSKEFLWQLTGQHSSGQTAGGGKNNLTLAAQGSGGASNPQAKFAVERFNNGASIGTVTTPITAAMRGKWVIHSFLIDMDNCPVTGSLAGSVNAHCSGVHGTPQFEWIIRVVDPITRAVLSTTTVVTAASTVNTPWGLDDTQDPQGWTSQLNICYKGSWCGNSQPGSYDGIKVLPITWYLDSFNIVDLNVGGAGFDDADPMRLDHP